MCAGLCHSLWTVATGAYVVSGLRDRLCPCGCGRFSHTCAHTPCKIAAHSLPPPALPSRPSPGPHIPWRPGRSDYAPEQFVALPDGRLPDGDKDAKHIRDIFYR